MEQSGRGAYSTQIIKQRIIPPAMRIAKCMQIAMSAWPICMTRARLGRLQ